MLKMVYQTSVGTFNSKDEAFDAEWAHIGGRRFLRMFDEHGEETYEATKAAYILYRSEQAHELVKDFMGLCGWTECEGSDNKRGMVYGIGFTTKCFNKNFNELNTMHVTAGSALDFLLRGMFC